MGSVIQLGTFPKRLSLFSMFDILFIADILLEHIILIKLLHMCPLWIAAESIYFL